MQQEKQSGNLDQLASLTEQILVNNISSENESAAWPLTFFVLVLSCSTH